MDPQLTSTIIDRDALLDCSSHGVTCLALEKLILHNVMHMHIKLISYLHTHVLVTVT